ncbi:MAG TPA: HAMP domain-containing sensor histidine kinase [Terriglobia bacterium]|nr:HAMP domain-containing sensor histidine kinase [Terriglobia bacterium]
MHEDQKPQDSLVGVLRSLIHKLSQPLTALHGSLEVALMGESKKGACRRVLEQSIEETDRMFETLATLREVLEAEDPGDDFHPVRWRNLIAQVLEDLAPMARNKGLQLVLEPMADVYVKVNPPRVDAALHELFRQAIQRSARTGVIRIGLSSQEHWALLSVWDDGLPREAAGQAEKSQPAASFTEALEGTLPEWWILEHIIKSQGGWLEIEKIPPGGVRCRLYLPLASAEAQRPSSWPAA